MAAQALFTRSPARTAAAVMIWALLAPLAAADVSPAEQLQQLLASGELARTDNPVAANFFIEQGRGVLPAADEQRALEQLELSLRRQTGFMGRVMEGAFGAMSGRTMQQLMEQQRKQAGVTGAVGAMFGLGASQPAITPRQQTQIQQEMQAGMAGPWIRGVEAARALERLGEAQAAGRFYMNCLQMDPVDWFAEVCLDGILQMGPARASALLEYIVAQAEKASVGAIAGQGSGADAGEEALGLGTVPMRGAALRGLGALVGTGKLGAAERERALATLLQYADGKQNAPYYAAAASGLGRTGDARAVEPLRRLAKYRKDPRVAEEARRALAVGFHDEDAQRRLRDYLDEDDPQAVMRAFRSLLDAADESTFAWGVAQVTDSRAAESSAFDPRPAIVRALAANGGARAHAALREILARQAGNDWLQAWVTVALLELGDEAQLPAVQAALRKTDWTLDRPGIGALWGRISPLLNLALSAYMGQLDVMQAVQTLGNMIAQERARVQQKATERELAGLQLRWQAADALAVSPEPGAVVELEAMLVDPEPSVRMGAARALAVSASPAAYDVLPKALAADFGSEGGEARAPQIRAALLRAAIARYPSDPRTRALCSTAARDPDAGVRFVALLLLQKG